MKPLTLILCVAALVLAACSHATDPKPSPTTTPAPAVTDFEAAWVEFWKVADGRATITMDSDSEANPHPMTIESGPEGFVATDGTSTVVFQPDVRPNAILVDEDGTWVAYEVPDRYTVTDFIGLVPNVADLLRDDLILGRVEAHPTDSGHEATLSDGTVIAIGAIAVIKTPDGPTVTFEVKAAEGPVPFPDLDVSAITEPEPIPLPGSDAAWAPADDPYASAYYLAQAVGEVTFGLGIEAGTPDTYGPLLVTSGDELRAALSDAFGFEVVDGPVGPGEVSADMHKPITPDPLHDLYPVAAFRDAIDDYNLCWYVSLSQEDGGYVYGWGTAEAPCDASAVSPVAISGAFPNQATLVD